MKFRRKIRKHKRNFFLSLIFFETFYVVRDGSLNATRISILSLFKEGFSLFRWKIYVTGPLHSDIHSNVCQEQRTTDKWVWNGVDRPLIIRTRHKWRLVYVYVSLSPVTISYNSDCLNDVWDTKSKRWLNRQANKQTNFLNGRLSLRNYLGDWIKHDSSWLMTIGWWHRREQCISRVATLFLYVSGKNRVYISCDFYGRVRYEDHRLRLRGSPRGLSSKRLEHIRFLDSSDRVSKIDFQRSIYKIKRKYVRVKLIRLEIRKFQILRRTFIHFI